MIRTEPASEQEYSISSVIPGAVIESPVHITAREIATASTAANGALPFNIEKCVSKAELLYINQIAP
ncbi:MAG: hypothetical protein ACI8XU_002744 [Kiritimatiellia bacterium]|jgi:hypothetical protein